MLEARIIADQGSLYYASQATAYDLETLRQHLQQCRCGFAGDVTLELTVDEDPSRPLVVAWLWSLTQAGYQVRVLRKPRDRAA